MNKLLTDPFGPNSLHIGLGKTNETLRMLSQSGSQVSSPCGQQGRRESSPIIFVSTREEVEKSDIRRLVTLGSPRQSIAALKALRGRVIYTVSGYDDVADELFEVEEVRRFYAHAQATWPCWLYTAHLDTPSFRSVVLSLLPHLTVERRKPDDCWWTRIRKCDVEAFFEASLAPVAILHHRTGISRQRGLQHLNAAAAYLGMPAT